MMDRETFGYIIANDGVNSYKGFPYFGSKFKVGNLVRWIGDKNNSRYGNIFEVTAIHLYDIHLDGNEDLGYIYVLAEFPYVVNEEDLELVGKKPVSFWELWFIASYYFLFLGTIFFGIRTFFDSKFFLVFLVWIVCLINAEQKCKKILKFLEE